MAKSSTKTQPKAAPAPAEPKQEPQARNNRFERLISALSNDPTLDRDVKRLAATADVSEKLAGVFKNFTSILTECGWQPPLKPPPAAKAAAKAPKPPKVDAQMEQAVEVAEKLIEAEQQQEPTPRIRHPKSGYSIPFLSSKP
ncbi:MAG TPA: hypothetical protein VGK96_07240 [Candidatus Sulfotelmatobacter sp.]|jgi:predicted small lipoprotein YifL